MNTYVLSLQEIDRSMLMVAGGKGANLGELNGIEGVQVPEGFCVTTEAYKTITGNHRELRSLLDELSQCRAEERSTISSIIAAIRSTIEDIPMPTEMAGVIEEHLAKVGEQDAYAVRSSGTAEDLPSASFAGQQDTYLNIVGKKAILRHIQKCWASLFTERAESYRLQAGIDHRNVYLAVVVQKMVFPQAAGILFTADPVSSNRKVVSIDASFGLGEALVSGLVNADTYRVGNGKIIGKKIATKKLAIYALKEGGTKEQVLEPERQNSPVLTDAQILELERLGKKIEAHFGQPQDIEWCLAEAGFSIVQSRPVTTLFPVPEAADAEKHVYVSVGHQQMMTDPMKPLGLSFYQLTAGRPMYKAGGRLFVDVAPLLASPASQKSILNVLGKSDPLIKDALTTILEREDFIAAVDTHEQTPAKSNPVPPPPDFQTLNDYDPAVVGDLIGCSETSLQAVKQTIQTKSGPALFDFIREDIQVLKKQLSDPKSFGVIMTGMNASLWINEKMEEWLGEKSAADMLSQSVSNNITSEMGLALLDVADVIRPYPDVIRYLQEVKNDHFLEELVHLDGGKEVRDAIHAFLNKYGMRCVGEIDITRPRWSEKPATLVPLLLSNCKNVEPGAGKRKWEQGLQEAKKKEKALLSKLKGLPDGEEKAGQTIRMINLLRNYMGYREYPKYGMVSRYWVYKQAILKEAGRLVQAGIIREKEDIFYLSFEELHKVVRTNKADYGMICRRKAAYRSYKKLTPPRVITSDGEIITGRYIRENLPAGAIAGLAVSAGVIEGRARVILTMEDASLEEGDILVTVFTDPSWTPLFVSIKGLVTEVGGLMTHGAVIAREYGLPAVVGVEHATRLLKDGQRIRVNGTEGYVEIL